MTTKEPNVSSSERYELRQAAEALDVSPSTITKWTLEGKMKAGIRRANGRRFWTGAEILRLWRAAM